jgi:plasmid stabilization system protein ParE
MFSHSDNIDLSDEGRDDLAEISAHGIDEWGESDSFRYFSELIQTMERIEEFPLIGQRLDGDNQRIHRFPFKSHVIFYRPDEASDMVEIVRVLHARMDARRHLGLS